MSNIKVTPAELKALNKTLTTQASQVKAVQSKISSAIKGTDWNSPAATKFKGDWNTKYVKALNELEKALVEFGKAAGTMAQNYESTEAAYKGAS